MSIEFREADSSRRWRRKPSHTAFTIEPPNPKCYKATKGVGGGCMVNEPLQ